MQQVKPKNSYLGLIVIAGIAAVLMLILAAVIGAFLITRQLNADSSSLINPLIITTPLNRLVVDDVDPALSLTALGGAPEFEVILEAIDKARPETALAGLLFNPTLTNKESAGGFLQLAMAYSRAGQNNKAAFSYKMAGTIATLGPDMPDTVRADVFLQAGEGLIKLNEAALAKFYLDQAFTIASRSPFLQAAHRRTIFERLQKNYIILDQRALARQSLSLSANPPSIAQIAKEQTVLAKAEPAPLPESAQQAEAARWLAAQELAALLVARGGKPDLAKVENLAQALIAEDEQKLPYYQSQIDSVTQLSKRIDLVMAKISWLSIKYRVARKAYGLSLVPEWEANAEQIRAELTKSYESLFTLYADLIIALPNASQIDKATEERLRSEILAGELGRYPNYPEQQRQKQLLDATEQLIETQPEINIFVGIGSVNNEELFTLISLE